MNYNRLISLKKNVDKSFFLWGSRQTGKSTLLRTLYPDAYYIDLLKSDVFAQYTRNPSRLREIDTKAAIIIIDEIQKIPELLDEVHWCIENQELVFGLCGSSARKVKRGHANLLGGRALRYELYGLSGAEIGSSFDLIRILNRGYLPNHYDSSDENIKRLMLSYVGDYLREEIASEGLVRNLTMFSDFLEMATLSDSETINFSSFARDLGVSAHTAKEYFNILIDTLIAWYLPLYRKRPKRKAAASTKLYFSDVGIVNLLAKRGELIPGSELFGKAFENWIAHELRCYNQYKDRFQELSYWRSNSGDEVDFIIGDGLCAIEAKGVTRLRDEHFRGLRAITKDLPNVQQRILVTFEGDALVKEDGIRVINHRDFINELWNGLLF
ncbi:MAG: ATP-binding protein [Oligoflexus sp.]